MLSDQSWCPYGWCVNICVCTKKSNLVNQGTDSKPPVVATGDLSAGFNKPWSVNKTVPIDLMGFPQSWDYSMRLYTQNNLLETYRAKL